MTRISVLIFIFCVQVVKAQKNNAAQALLDERCKHQYISLPSQKIKDKQKESFLFRTVEVVDYRADSSRIGLFVLRGFMFPPLLSL